MSEIENLKKELKALSKENFLLQSCLHDAIAKPMGVVPKSAESYYEPERFFSPSQRKINKGGL